MEDESSSPSVPRNEPTLTPSELRFPVVGIGASAGGLAAVTRFLEQMPSDNGMAFCVVLLLSPKHKIDAPSILQRATRMRVVQVTQRVPIERNHVYVIAPTFHLSMDDGHLDVSRPERPRGQRVAIDLFFRTLADVHKELAIGVVLSGAGADGAVGIARLKEQGGVTFAQAPHDAEHESMPVNAIATGVVDFVLPVVEMPQKLIEICRNAKAIKLPHLNAQDAPPAAPEGAGEGDESEVALRDVITLLRNRTGQPPSAVLDAQGTILHMTGGATKFLRHVAGEPSHVLVQLVLPELRLELRAAILQAAQVEGLIESRPIYTTRDGRSVRVTMKVRSFREPSVGGDFVLVMFEESDVPADVAPGAHRSSDEHDAVAGIEAELERTREHLQQVIAQAETSNEELRASNEELTTVNHELELRVEQTSNGNDDLRNFIAAADIALVFVDASLCIKRYTPRALDIFSLIPSDVGRPLLDITHKLDYVHLGDDTLMVLDALRVVEREVRGIDGRYYFVRILPYRTTDNRIDGAVLTFIDITGRRQAEEMLRLGEEHLRLVAESTRDYAIITLDEQGRVTSWNGGAERIFGFSATEMIGSTCHIIFTPEDRINGVPEDELHRALVEGRAEDERWHLRKDGTRFYCSGVMTPLRVGGLRGFAKIARDQTGSNTSRRQLEVQLAREKNHLEHAQSSLSQKNQFLAVLSHELKHPLNVIQMNVDILRRLPEIRRTPVAEKATRSIGNSLAAQAKIIDDLLDLSRLQTGKLALTCGPVDLGALVEPIVDGIARSGAQEHDIRIELPETSVVVDADVVRIEQIVWNLLSNARKFTPAGGHIRVRVDADATMGIIEIIDDGQGIAPEDLERIFEMFGQAESPTSRNKGGLGVALALVRQLVELQRGRVCVESEGVGHGTRARVELPLYVVADDHALRSSRPPASSIAGLRILLVDDTVDTLDTFAMLLELEGAQVTTATTADGALELLRTEDFDVMASDLGMPEMDGFELVSALRASERNADIIAIAVSGFTQPGDVRRAIDAGFSAHLSKPMILATLVETVARLRGEEAE